MGSELIYRGHGGPPAEDDAEYSPRPEKRLLWLARPFRYLLREQRLLFVLVGMALVSVFFAFAPPSGAPSSYDARLVVDRARQFSVAAVHGEYRTAFERGFVGAKVPLGLKRKRLRVVVTGGAGFVGSHLVDRLIERGDSVIVVDNFFTGRKENLVHHFGNPNFELIRHDVVEPLLLEVDQIYHLACPASPVHYKFNPHPQTETYWGNVNPIGMTPSTNLFLDPSLQLFAFGKHSTANAPEVATPSSDLFLQGRACLGVVGTLLWTISKVCFSSFVGQSMGYLMAHVEGLIKLMEGEHVGPFNLGNPGEFTMLELAKVVQDTIDPDAKIEFRPNTADDPHKRKPDITRAKELLGWEPKMSLREGLPLMVSDFRKRIFGDHSEVDSTASGTTTITDFNGSP
ncbi:hypothetical protein BHM03_00010922 [Ensete ventricosum]|nr:hypothetical protein BHM03_00010922 [Ensete ventricosum]